MKDNVPTIYIAKNIEYLRKTRNMTQKKLGDLLKKDYSTIGKWEKEINQPSIEDTFKMAIIFNVDWKDFILKDLSKCNNDNYQFITKITSNNSVELIIDKTKPITAETVVEVQRTLIDEMNNNKDNKT